MYPLNNGMYKITQHITVQPRPATNSSSVNISYFSHTGSPPAIRRPPREPTSANTTPKAKKSRPKDIDVLGILNSTVDTQPLINVAVVSNSTATLFTMSNKIKTHIFIT